MHLNIEIKARTKERGRLREILLEAGARFHGEDQQTDTYFHTPEGRLKLREGFIERNLIFYRRGDQAGPKASEVFLYRPDEAPLLRELLTAALGVRQVVNKRREIYFAENVKFHLDLVEGLGEFVEIEAIDMDGHADEARLRAQCAAWMERLGIRAEDLLEGSYSEM
ncbi:MAG: class IV adenylate cyclase [Bacteroidia bacterium]|nr:class IV adenylate cyclase [Bacteroidia bacterium]